MIAITSLSETGVSLFNRTLADPIASAVTPISFRALILVAISAALPSGTSWSSM